MKILYRLAPHNGGAVFASEIRAHEVARIHTAIAMASNWGEFSAAMDKEELEKLLSEFDEEDEPRPGPDEPFEGEYLGGWTDGDYPPWLQSEMESLIPRDVLELHATRQSTFLNGDFWFIPEAQMELMAEALRQRGLDVERVDDLPFH